MHLRNDFQRVCIGDTAYLFTNIGKYNRLDCGQIYGVEHDTLSEFTPDYEHHLKIYSVNDVVLGKYNLTTESVVSAVVKTQ